MTGVVISVALTTLGALPHQFLEQAGSSPRPGVRIEEWTSPPSALPQLSRPTAVLPDGEVLWVGTEQGLVRLAPDGPSAWSVPEGLPHRVVTSLSLDAQSGELWVGTMGGLARFSAGRIDSFTQLDSGLANDVVYRVAADQGEVWAATASGTSRLDTRRGEWEIFDHTNARMHEPWCYAAILTADTVYLGVWGGGVLERARTGGEWRVHRDPDGQMEVDLLRDDGLVSDVVSSLSLDDGVLWVATYFGISRYDGRRWQSYAKADSGLCSDFVNVIVARDGLMFAGTDQGLSVFDGMVWTTYQSGPNDGGRWTRLNQNGVPQGRGTTRGSIPGDHILDVALQGQDLWLATLSGLAHGVLVEGGPDAEAGQ